jgi:hypothetical protein
MNIINNGQEEVKDKWVHTERAINLSFSFLQAPNNSRCLEQLKFVSRDEYFLSFIIINRYFLYIR